MDRRVNELFECNGILLKTKVFKNTAIRKCNNCYFYSKKRSLCLANDCSGEIKFTGYCSNSFNNLYFV